jgi:TolA-binding protein
MQEQDMSEEQQKHSAEHQTLVDKKAIELTEVTEVIEFLKKHAKKGGIAICLLIITVFGLQALSHIKEAREANASIALMEAKSADALQQIINNFSATQAAPVAKLRLANLMLEEGDFATAASLFSEVAKSSNETLAIAAKFGTIACLEATQKIDEAAAAYTAFADANSSSYLATEARMAAARCLKTLGNVAEAKIIYEDIQVDDQAQSYHNQAAIALKMLNN